MHRIDSSGATVDNKFSEGNPQTQTLATAVSSDWLNDEQENTCNAVEAAGLSLSKGDYFQLEKAIIALSKDIGQLITSEIELTPVTLSAARNNANPTGPKYRPLIPRHDADHDVSAVEAPDAIDPFRAQKVVIGGISDFSIASVVGSRITLAANSANTKLLAALTAAGMMNRYISSGKSATFAASGVDFAYASRIYCVTVNGIEYPITAVSIASNYIDVSGSPASVATFQVYPFRIAAQATKIRLRCLAGLALVGAGSDESEPLLAMTEMDRFMLHWHKEAVGSDSINADSSNPGTGYRAGRDNSGSAVNRSITTQFNTIAVQDPIASTLGDPRAGKSTEVRRLGVALYTFVGRLLATTWT